MKIYLVRHGQDDPSVRGGWSNHSLTPEGKKQAEALAERIMWEQLPVDKILSSDLPRAMQTAVPISQKLDLPIIPMPQFREVNNGDLAGMENAVAAEKYPGLYWNTLDWEELYPNGESPKEFYERIKAAWKELSKMDGNILLVTHGGVIHVLLSIISGKPYSNTSKHPQIEHCALIEIEWETTMQRKYYEAYDDRYRQIHSQNLQWFDNNPSAIVMETIRDFGITAENKLLELGCGEGRDAFTLLQAGFDLMATDISPEAIRFCRERYPEFEGSFTVLDCVAGEYTDSFDFILAVAVLHMLVEDVDRKAFYTFIRKHLTPNGIALICTMGDGELERQSDSSTAFDLQDRVHEQSGKVVKIASTSCRIVSFTTLREELNASGLAILKEGTTSVEPDFTAMMYAVVRRKEI